MDTPTNPQRHKQNRSNHWPELSLIEHSPTTAHYALSINASLVWFDGHFPKQPVLAGVTQTHWACLLAKEVFKISKEFCGYRKLKFQTPVLPGQQLNLTLHYRAEKNQVKFTYANEHSTFSSGTLLFDLTE